MNMKQTSTWHTKTLLVLALLFAVSNVSADDVIKGALASKGKGITHIYSKPDAYPYQSFFRPFKIKVRTYNSGGTNNKQFQIPTKEGGYFYKVDCESDGTIEADKLTGNYTCNYPKSGDYTISIYGTFPRIYFDDLYEDIGKDRKKLLSIEQWGMVKWRSMEGAFAFCTNMTLNASDQPNLSNVTDMSRMFTGASAFNGNVGSWDVSNVTNMSELFNAAYSFNQDISNWDVGQVTNMRYLFAVADAFNQDISNWDVSKVVKMHAMFLKAKAFNQNISHWDVGSATNMSAMFSGASAFNQDISHWRVSNVTSMYAMFKNALSFNQDLGNWDVSNVTLMNDMFLGISLSIDNYNSLLNGWSRLTLKQNTYFHGGYSVYSNSASEARDRLMSDYAWHIDDGGYAWWVDFTF